jgi:hypothetical protein
MSGDLNAHREVSPRLEFVNLRLAQPGDVDDLREAQDPDRPAA